MENKNYLEQQLKEIGVDAGINAPAKRNDKPSLIDFIRRSSYNNEAQCKGKVIPLFVIGKRIEEIAVINQSVEDAVNMEILGLRPDILGRVIYKIKKVFRNDSSTAEQIIGRQTERVTNLRNELDLYSQSLDTRIERLEHRYKEVVNDLVGRSREVGAISERLAKANELIPQLTKALDDARTEEEIIKLKVAEREIRKKIISWADYMSKNEGVKEFLNKEQKILDGLSTVCGAYSSALKNILQHADLMHGHLKTITPIYIDMIRSRHVNESLRGEVKRLGEYVSRMNNAFQKGLGDVVYKAKGTPLGGDILSSLDKPISGAVAEIEESTFSTLSSLEQRMLNYSQKLKGGPE